MWRRRNDTVSRSDTEGARCNGSSGGERDGAGDEDEVYAGQGSGSRSLRSAGWLYAESCPCLFVWGRSRLYQSRNCGEVEGQCNLPERGVPVGNTEWQGL